MTAVNEAVLDQAFRKARTFNRFQADKPVSDATLQELYETLKWGPTAMNAQPGRYLLLKSREAKARLLPLVAQGNQEKVASAPVNVLVAAEPRFYELLPKLMPPLASMRDVFAANEGMAVDTAVQSALLQTAYLIVAARLLGLDCGPMSGFDAERINAEFFADGPYRGWRVQLLVNLGYGSQEKLYPRAPRLSFDEAAHIL